MTHRISTLLLVFRTLVYLLGLFSFVVLFATGFWPVLVLGEHLSGYLLMVHATFGPVFAGCLAVLVIMWAENNKFDKNYWPGLQKLLGREVTESIVDTKHELVEKIVFWLIVVTALPVILSIVLSMFPVFGTTGQKMLLQLHGYSTIFLALLVIIHTYLIIRAKTR